MESRVARVEKYYQDDCVTNTSLSRSDRNSRLYRQVYGKYEGLDNLPMDDNSDEIDLERLKEIVSGSEKKSESKITPPSGYNFDFLEQKKKDIAQNRVYDINKLLEKAKYENNKLKEPENKIIKKSKDILSTLESTELSVDEIKEACKKYDFSSNNEVKDNSLAMTREMKYQTRQISVDPLIEQVIPANDIALDLLSDLKPTGDTIVTEPILGEKKEDDKDVFFVNKENTTDIDVLKDDKKVDEDFFTSSYQFSKKDFSDDEDFFDGDVSNHNVLKVILLVLAIVVFAGVIFYFVMNYGIGV